MNNLQKYTVVFCLLSLFWTLQKVQAQSEKRGLPSIKNYASRDYDAHSQNYALTQDNRGILYVGNTTGILEFDGIRWRKILTSNGTMVRSLATDKDGIVYAGARGEFGYLHADSLGNLGFVPLSTKVAPEDQNFVDIWQIHPTPQGVFFVSYNKLFRWDGKKLKSWSPSKALFHRAFWLDGILYVQDLQHGLMMLQGDELKPAPDADLLGKGFEIYAMLPYSKGRILIVTDIKGLFLYDGQQLTKLATSDDKYLIANQVSDAKILTDGNYALATSRGGLLIMNPLGKIVERINKQTGLQDDNIHGLFADRENNLWLALNNGLAKVQWPSPFAFYKENSGLRGAVTDVIRHNGQLYASTDQGVFMLGVNGFLPVKGILSAGWDLIEAENSLLVATSMGVFEINGLIAKYLNSDFSLSLHQSTKQRNKVYVGLLEGILTLNREGGSWKSGKKWPTISDEIRKIEETTEHVLWAETPSGGLLQLNDDKQTPEMKRFTTENGLPSLIGNYLALHENQVIVTTFKGIFKYDVTQQKFVPYAALSKQLLSNETLWLHQFKEDKFGRIWTTNGDETNVTYFAKNDKKVYESHHTPFRGIRETIVSAIYPENAATVWFGTPEGLVRYDAQLPKDYKIPFAAVLRRVVVNQDSVLFEGTFTDSLAAATVTNNEKRVFDHKNNSFIFEFGASSYEREADNLFRFQLEGNTKSWSQWSHEGKAVFSNLSPGTYKFRVQAQNLYGQVGEESLYQFTVLAPWYTEWWAYTLYAVIGIAILSAYIRSRTKALERNALVLQSRIDSRTKQLSIEKERAEQEKERSDELLLNILPSETAEELKNYGKASPQHYEKVSVLFTDFKDFTKVAEKLSPQELVAELDRCFVAFDEIVVRHRMEKIKTIGDAYMCAGGIPTANNTNPTDAVLAGLEIIEFLEGVKAEKEAKGEPYFTIRVGIHTGQVVAGVVGKKKFAYDIWGDAVNLASRMESSGEPGKVNISGETYELVKSRFNCEYRGKVYAKNKGDVDMYFVNSKK